MTRFGSRLPRRTEFFAAPVLLLALGAAGCVTQGKHDQIVGALEAEKSELEDRVRDLERSNQSLDQERVQLLDEMEDLREARAALSRDVEKLTRTKDLLTEHLRKREAEVQELSQLRGTYKGLVSELEAEVAAGQIQIEQLREGIRLNLPQDILFPSGSAALDPRGEAVLRKVAGKLHDPNHRIEVQGHTDNVPISGALAQRFHTNWELAAARAARVVRLLEDAKIDASRLTAVSFGENAPVAPNDDPQGRARNRRIEFVLLPGPRTVPDPRAGGSTAPEGTAPPDAPASPSPEPPPDSALPR